MSIRSSLMKVAGAIFVASATMALAQVPDQAAILKGHNEARALVGASPLVWDDALVTSANNWASTCPEGHSGDALRQGASENLGWGWPTFSETDVTAAWVEERKDLVNGVCNPGKDCAHYILIARKDITAIGCATKLGCASVGQTSVQTWVCHYKESTTSPQSPLVTISPIAPNASVMPSAAPMVQVLRNHTFYAAPAPAPTAPIGVAAAPATVLPTPEPSRAFPVVYTLTPAPTPAPTNNTGTNVAAATPHPTPAPTPAPTNNTGMNVAAATPHPTPAPTNATTVAPSCEPTVAPQGVTVAAATPAPTAPEIYNAAKPRVEAAAPRKYQVSIN